MAQREVLVVDYNPQWKATFETEKHLLANILGENAVKIDHIGSTAVPGLAAKPVIDILIEVTSLEALDAKSRAMEILGYQVKGENGIAGRRYFQKGEAVRSHHIHAFVQHDEHLFRHRAFVTYLIENPAIAQHYSQIKKSAAQQCDNDIIQYMALKNDFIAHHEKLALLSC